jgi:hypothetical protein
MIENTSSFVLEEANTITLRGAGACAHARCTGVVVAEGAVSKGHFHGMDVHVTGPW